MPNLFPYLGVEAFGYGVLVGLALAALLAVAVGVAVGRKEG